MNLNTIKPARGAKTVRKRLGRGIGSGLGKTAGKGHKGQKARKGVSIFGFEGGQTPLQRRLPKSGFISQKARHVDNIRLFELAKVADDSVTLASLRAAGLINRAIKEVKIILNGELTKKVIIADKKIKVTAGARKAIEALGGQVKEVGDEA